MEGGMLLREWMPGRHVPSAGARHRSIAGWWEFRGQGEVVGSSPMSKGSILGGRDSAWLGTATGPCVGPIGAKSLGLYLGPGRGSRDPAWGAREGSVSSLD